MSVSLTTDAPQKRDRSARAETYKTAPGAPAISARAMAAAARLEAAAAAALTHSESILERTGLPASAPINSMKLKQWEEAPSKAPKVRPSGTRRLADLTPEELRIAESRLYWLSRVHHKTPAEISAELNLRESDLEALSKSRPLNR